MSRTIIQTAKRCPHAAGLGGVLAFFVVAGCASLEPLPARYLKARGLQRFEPTAAAFYDRANFFLAAGAHHFAIRDLKEARKLRQKCDAATGYFPARALATATLALAEKTFDDAMTDVGASAERAFRRDVFAFRVHRALGLARLAAAHLDREADACRTPVHAELHTRIKAFQARVSAHFTHTR